MKQKYTYLLVSCLVSSLLHGQRLLENDPVSIANAATADEIAEEMVNTLAQIEEVEAMGGLAEGLSHHMDNGEGALEIKSEGSDGAQEISVALDEAALVSSADPERKMSLLCYQTPTALESLVNAAAQASPEVAEQLGASAEAICSTCCEDVVPALLAEMSDPNITQERYEEVDAHVATFCAICEACSACVNYVPAVQQAVSVQQPGVQVPASAVLQQQQQLQQQLAELCAQCPTCRGCEAFVQ